MNESEDKDGEIPNEHDLIAQAKREMAAEASKSADNGTLLEADFKKKFGVKFRSEPADVLQFQYGADGEVIVRIMQAPGGGASTAPIPPDEAPIDEKQENENPFAIKVEVASKAINGDWATAQLKVLSGLYSTQGGTAYNANGVAFPGEAHSELITKGVNGQYKGYVYLYVPLEIDNAGGVPVSNAPNKFKAADGGVVRLRSSPAVVWPQIVKVAGGGAATSILIGSWGVQRVNVSAGTPTYELRVQIDQKVTDNIVLGNPAGDDESETPVPFGEATNDMLYWDHATGQKRWTKLAAPSTSGIWVPGVKDGVMQWFGKATC